MRWPPRNECLSKAKTRRKKNKKTNRLAQHYKCNKCKKDFTLKEVVVDHIHPVIDPKRGFVSWDEYIDRMFPDISGFQILCQNCHKEKSNMENKQRKANG